MKFFHLADLHLGKSIYGLSMLEDQRYWIDRFLERCEQEKPDAVLIAGDVYDRSAPGGDAVELLDHLLTTLAEMDITVFMIAGNHDSGQRLSFGQTILAKQKIHIAGTVQNELNHITLNDSYGPVTFWLMPYTYPEQAASVLEDPTIKTYDQAVHRLIEAQAIDRTQRNVILAHQNVTADGKEAERGGSESMVGGVGQVDWNAFDGFEYAALGHIHSAYPVGRKTIRYAGTPLCYHFTETRQANRGIMKVVLGEKGSEPELTLESIPPLHPMRSLKGTKDEIYDLLANDEGQGEYIGITITDQRITPEIHAYLRRLLAGRGSVLMELLSEYTAFAGSAVSARAEAVKTRSLEELFSDMYTEQSGGTPPDDAEYDVMRYVGELVRNQDCHLPMDERDITRITAYAGKAGKNA